MTTKMRPTSFLFPPAALDELRRLAHLESLDSGRQVTPSSIVRGLVEEYVRDRRERRSAPPAPAA